MHRSSGRDDPVRRGLSTEETRMTNDDQRAAWNGASGANWVDQQERYDRTLEPWAVLLADTAAVTPGERVLDVGCGCGATTLDAARRTGAAGAALGVDLSAPMIAVALRRAEAEGLVGASFRVGDAQTADLGVEAHDVVVSRFGVMFFDDPVAAFANLRKAVRPGGRLAFAVWAALPDQEWITVAMAAALTHLPPAEPAGPAAAEDAPGLFSLARPERTIDLLTQAGWDDVAVDRQQRQVLFGGGGTVDDAVAFLAKTGPARALLDGVDEATVARTLDAVREAFAAYHTPDGVVLGGTAWMVTSRR
jgi:ubiquinone/menaquinone biosynthesis C-methylase UbiE